MRDQTSTAKTTRNNNETVLTIKKAPKVKTRKGEQDHAPQTTQPFPRRGLAMKTARRSSKKTGAKRSSESSAQESILY